MQLYSPRVIRTMMDKYQIYPNKNLGQNFLIDNNIIKRISDIANLTNEDVVLEIGPGFGALTKELVDKCKHVYAIEIDQKLTQLLKENFSNINNLTVVNGDALQLDYQSLLSKEYNSTEIKVVANLPYYITTPLVLKLVRHNININKLIFMVQEEVANRFLANPGEKEYSAVSVILDFYCIGNKELKIPKNVFYPKPKVESSVISLHKRATPKVKVSNEDKFIEFVKTSFHKKRKTLLNNLTDYYLGDKEQLKELFTNVNIDIKVRAEQLSVEEFAQIFEIFYNNS